MNSFINWGRGREKDLETLLPLFPKNIDTLVVPFLGSGDVLLNVNANAFTAGDRCDELIDLWRFVSKPQPRLLEMMSLILELWESLPRYCKGFEGRLLDLHDCLVLEEPKDYLALVSDVGEMTKGLSFPEQMTFSFKGWKTEDFCMELRHQLVAAIELAGKLGITSRPKLQKRMVDAELVALYEYLVYMYNDSEARPRVKAAILLWTMSCAKGHLFQKDEWENYCPDVDLTGADCSAFRMRMKVLESPRFLARMKQASFYKRDALALLKGEQPDERDFIFADPPCLYGRRKKKGRFYSKKAQESLADFLLNKTGARWMVILPKQDPIVEKYLAAGAHTLALADELLVWNY